MGLYFLFLLSFITRRTISVLSHTHTRSTRYTNCASSLSPPILHPLLSTTQNGINETALIKAAEYGFVDAVKALVAADPDPAHLDMKVSIP